LGTENTAAIARFGAPMPLDYSTLPPCPACNGYGTADGHPAPTTTAAALLVEGCAACGGTGDAVEVGS
jgi:DnaJ-class molecular chaperone